MTAAAADRRVPDVVVSLSAEQVYVYEQVVFEVQVRHGLDEIPSWDAPAFEGFWSERLETQSEEIGGTADAPRFLTRFRRALFPVRSGALAIGSSQLRVAQANGAEQRWTAPGAALQVGALPEEGRPDDFSGLVGQIEVRASLERPEVAIGRDVPLEIEVYGEANLWDLRELDLAGCLDPSLEVFPEPSRLIRSEHGGRLTVRRIFALDLVPRHSGVYEIPALGLSYFDPGRGRYARARAPSLRLAAVTTPQARAPWEESSPPARPPSLRLLALALAVVVGTAISGAALAGWWRNSRQRLARPPKPRPKALLHRAEVARDPDAFPPLLSAALRAGIHVRHDVDPSALTTDELAARIDDPEALALLRDLDHARFTGAPLDRDALLARTRRYLDG